MHLKPSFEVFDNERLFCVSHEPDTPTNTAVLYVPPFAEEANRTRHLAARQARELASRGCMVLVFDPFGTGDSSGDFGDATWARWCTDLRRVTNWLHASGYRNVSIWGARLGCALALDAGLFSENKCGIFWQPHLSPRAQLRHYLRMKVASRMSDSRRLSVGELERELQTEGHLDIGGYRISRRLADEMNASQPADKSVLPDTLLWIEVASADTGTLSPPSAATIQKWRSRGADVKGICVAGDQFWATQTLGFAPALIEETTRWLTAKALNGMSAL